MKLSHFVARGLPRDQAERVAREIADCPAAKRVLSGGDSGRLVIGAKPSDVTGLPASHPPVRNFVACPIGAHGTTFGWMYVADRLAEGVFSTDDERIVLALGAQFAIAWEGLALYTDLERQVAQRTKQLEQSNRELEAFSFSVSHDLRAPLRAIDGFTRMVLEEHSGGLPAEGQRLLGMVRGQTQKMAKLIDDLLELARVGRRELGFHPVKLDDFVRNCLRELESELEGRKVELVIGELPTWNADPILLKQLFLNLLSNALKYTRKREAARIEIGAEPRAGEQVVYVRDNGVGFDMAEATKLFTVFQRLHAEEEYPGTGIGLAIVRRVAERHGGSVWAQAEPDRGAVFYVALPAAPEA
jgi:signal transduction histidine kinase